MTLARKHSKYDVPQQFVEMLLFQNKPWLVRYKKIRALSFLPSVECGKFKLKKALQSGKILACTKKSVISAIPTLKLIKMMLKSQVAKASSTDYMHALLESDYAILPYILHFFALCRGPKWGGAWHNAPTLNTFWMCMS